MAPQASSAPFKIPTICASVLYSAVTYGYAGYIIAFSKPNYTVILVKSVIIPVSLQGMRRSDLVVSGTSNGCSNFIERKGKPGRKSKSWTKTVTVDHNEIFSE